MDWARILSDAFWVQVVSAGLGAGVPLIFAALGATVSERSGVFNLGVEGIMLLGGLAGFVGAYFSGSLWVGVLSGAAIGLLLGLVFAVWVVTLKANQIVTGYALLALCGGTSVFFYRVIFSGARLRPQLGSFPGTDVPLLSEIPFIGPVLFQQDMMVYLLYFLVLVMALMLYGTKLGLRITAVGEYPAAADTVGVNVSLVRYAGVMIGTALAGVGGAYFSLAVLGLYADGMVAGRGFIALALVKFGRWDPFWVFGGGLLFGTVEALQSRLQFLGVPLPTEFLVMLPYVLTIVMVLIGRRRAGPSALTIPYSREG